MGRGRFNAAVLIAVALAAAAPAIAADGGKGDRGGRSGHADKGEKGGGGKGGGDKGDPDKGSELGDKPIGRGSCAKRVRELKQVLAKQSYLPKANGSCMGEDEGWAIDAFQRQEGLRPTGRADRKTVKRLARSERPKARKGGSGDRLLVSIRRQLLYIVEHDRVRRTVSVSSGRSGFQTPRGSYKIFRKERNSFSGEFNVNLPWASYFHNGMAFHGSADVQPRGVSHGCIRVPPQWAREVYRKAPMGRQVVVF
jgi:L,D-transpeptidase-like protein/putative peptidoglycan binding protein